MPKVLVVDDSAMDRRLIGGLLERESGLSVQYAENGSQALSAIQKNDFDIVVTDLQMPGMDGLNLVQSVRVQFADLPVILITGQGSEQLAVDALASGAASYVPKSKVADILPKTVEDVLAMVRADRSFESLIDSMTQNSFVFDLANDANLVDPLVDLVQQMVYGIGLCDAIGRVRVGIALEQALLNAMFRGNLEIGPEQLQPGRDADLPSRVASLVELRKAQPPYCDRRTRVQIDISREECEFLIRDEGPGFDVSSLPEPGDPAALEREGGRGLVLMRTFMDEVMFNGKGNEVTLIKRKDAVQ